LVVLAWVALNVGLVYYQTYALGYANPHVGPLNWPYIVVFGGCLSLILLPYAKGIRVVYVWLLMYVLIYWAGINSSLVAAPVSIANLVDSELNRFLYYIAYALPFWTSLLTPLAIFTQPGTRPWQTFGIVNFKDRKNHRGPLIKGTIWFLVIFFITNMYLKGHLVMINLLWPPMTFVLGTLLFVLFETLIRHFVCLGMAKLIIDKILGDDEMFWVEASFLAILYGAMYYSYGWGIIFRELAFGLVLAYLYLKTKSLSYGLILCSVTRVFAL